jgi:large subunit ribosomal protein L28
MNTSWAWPAPGRDRGRTGRPAVPAASPRRTAGPASYNLRAMSKICHVCRKGPAFGNNRSHSMVATRRRFDPNLQRVRIDDGGTPRRVYVCTRCLKAGKITKAR